MKFWNVITLAASVLATSLPESYSSQLEGDPKVTHIVKFTVEQKDQPLGELVIALFGETVPKTVDNFLFQSEKEDGYVGTQFHRVIPNFMVQGGQTKGGVSKYGSRFDDENFQLKHNKFGRLSCANAGPNTNLDQFFILNTDQTPHLDGHHVVFGQLVDGKDALLAISDAPKHGSDLDDPVTITRAEVTVILDNDNRVISNKGGSEAPVKAEPTPKWNVAPWLVGISVAVAALWGISLYREKRDTQGFKSS